LKHAALILVVAACYDPESINCTVSCAAADECAEGQVCGSDGLCAAPDVAGHCNGTDAGTNADVVMLRIVIEGQGKVTIEGTGLCDSDVADNGTCLFSVTSGIARELRASGHHGAKFAGWSSGCRGSNSSCAITPVMSLTLVGARFYDD
jgi:hypothetical protein